YGSEGKFEMLHTSPDAGDAKGVTESTDTYDTIEWLMKNVANNNGRVGMNGISYPGYLVTMGMVNPHPALKAVSEQACMGDTWLGDDCFHNGAFRLSYGFVYTALLETSNENFSFAFDSFEVYDFYWRLGRENRWAISLFTTTPAFIFAKRLKRRGLLIGCTTKEACR